MLVGNDPRNIIHGMEIQLEQMIFRMSSPWNSEGVKTGQNPQLSDDVHTSVAQRLDFDKTRMQLCWP